MARIATLLVVLAAAVAAPARANDAVHPDQFLESGTVTPHTSPDHPFTTTTSLLNHHWYRIVLTGVWELQWPGGQYGGDAIPPFESDVDSIYCRSQCDKYYYAGAMTWDGVGTRLGTVENYHVGGAHTAFNGSEADYNTPTANHTYDITFYMTGDNAGVVSFWDPYEGQYGDPGYPTSATGSFGFQLYGMKDDSGGGSTSGGGGNVPAGLPSAWRIGPIRFTAPAFKGYKFRFNLQSKSDATVYEKVTAYVGNKAYAAGKTAGVLPAGPLYSLAVRVPTRAFDAIVAGYKAGKTVIMRSTFKVVTSSGRVTKHIDVKLY